MIKINPSDQESLANIARGNSVYEAPEVMKHDITEAVQGIGSTVTDGGGLPGNQSP